MINSLQAAGPISLWRSQSACVGYISTVRGCSGYIDELQGRVGVGIGNLETVIPLSLQPPVPISAARQGYLALDKAQRATTNRCTGGRARAAASRGVKASSRSRA